MEPLLTYPWAGECGRSRIVPQCTLADLLEAWAVVQFRADCTAWAADQLDRLT